jgi:excisionase family DNA binding protein
VNEQNNIIDADQLLTSHQVGALLQVNPSSVKKWVNEGLIAAFRTPGGHRRIRAGDLVEFLDEHKMPIPRPLAGASKKRLLIVDDNLSHLKAVQRVLKPYLGKIQVSLTSNGIDALVLVGSFKPHLIVLDVFMPEIDGLEVCRRLKANQETNGITVLVATGNWTPEIETDALGAGARRCLQKPIDVHQVLEDLGVSTQKEM